MERIWLNGSSVHTCVPLIRMRTLLVLCHRMGFVNNKFHLDNNIESTISNTEMSLRWLIELVTFVAN